MRGIMISRRIRSGLCCLTFSSASTPSKAVTILTGKASRNACRSSTFWALSSTIKTVDCGRNDSLLGNVGGLGWDKSVDPYQKGPPMGKIGRGIDKWLGLLGANERLGRR